MNIGYVSLPRLAATVTLYSALGWAIQPLDSPHQWAVVGCAIAIDMRSWYCARRSIVITEIGPLLRNAKSIEVVDDPVARWPRGDR